MNKSIQYFVLVSSILLLSGCFLKGLKGVDHTGLLPTIPGQKYRIGCVFDSTNASSGASTRFTSAASYCFNGPPTPSAVQAAWEICSEWASVHEFEMNSTGSTSNVSVAEASERLLTGEECRLLDDTPPGIGAREDPLSTSLSAVLLKDDTGSMLGDSTLSNLQATVSQANFRVSANFLRWRHANTSGVGRVFFDVKKCTRSGPCTLILRHFDISLDDFTIVRPTRLAKDVKIRNAKLYTLKNYETTIDANGNFSFKNVKAVVSGIANGKKSVFISEKPTTITGSFISYRGSFRVAPKSLVLNINEASPSFAIKGAVKMTVNKFHARLRNEATNRCLRGTLDDRNVTRASIEGCRVNGWPKDWAFEKRRNGYQIKQAFSSSCLNLKTNKDNREGGPVYLVDCSNHQDQRWSVDNDGHIRHLASGKCLNVHKGRENKYGGLVTVYSCANTPDQRWALR